MVFGYLSGKVPARDFIAAARQNPDIPMWFQSIIPEEATYLDQPYIPYHHDEQGKAVYQRAASTHPFWKKIQYGVSLNVLSDRIDMSEYFRLTKDFDTAGGRLNAYEFLYSLALIRCPAIQKTDRYSKEFGFFLDVCGDCYGGQEVNLYLERLVLGVYYGSGGIGEKRRNAKQKVKEFLHITGRNIPRWVQSPEWPMGANSPMEYLSRKREGDLVQFIFRDVDTGEERIVEQFY